MESMLGEQIGLLVADVPWEVLHAALNATGAGERFEVGQAVADADHWYQEFPAQHTSTLLAGEHKGRSYVFSGASTVGPGGPDRVVALAAATGGLVLAHLYDDTSGTGDGVAARGDRLLRYVVEGMEDVHVEGAPLDGETDDLTIASSQGFDAVLTALGFEAEAWLAEGAKWEVTWMSLDPDTVPEVVPLYRGPVRMRSLWVEESALEEMGWRPDWWPEEGMPRPSGGSSDG